MPTRFILISLSILLVRWFYVDFMNSFREFHISNELVSCEIILDDVIVGDCEFGPETSNTSMVIVAIYLSWSDVQMGDQITIDFQGQSQFIDPFDISCPNFVSFSVLADGSTQDLVVRTISGDCPELRQSITLPSNCDPSICTSGFNTGGKVFADYNGNGIQDSSEQGITAIPIKIYGNDILLDSTESSTNGTWASNSINPGIPIRIEFEVPSGLFDGGPGAESNTRVQITQSGTCDNSLGIHATRDVVDENPWIATTCFAKGNIDDPNSASSQEPTIVLNRYFTAEGGPRTGPDGNYYVANAFETGSVWGLAYQRKSHKLISAAFLKRQAAWGSEGLGAIYLTELSDFFPDPPPSADYRFYGRTSLLLDLDDYNIETGDESSINRDLPNTPLAFSHDSDVFDLVGKWGLGDMDINRAGDSLFVVNLYSKSLIIIDIGNPLQLPITSDRVSEIPIPNPGCRFDDDWRPWGLKHHEGNTYIGGVCSAETTQDPNDLWAYVLRWDGSSFQETVDFNLNYPKGPSIGSICTTFKPWTPDFNRYRVMNDIVCGPSPLLSDIEFDSKGNLLLSLGDRFGYQTGGRDYGPDTNDVLGYVSFTAGDILKLYKLKDDYLLEKNATSGFFTSAGANNNQGICGGEFFFEDAFLGHQESILGALAVHPSYNTTLATIMDPSTIWSNGWSQMNNSDGRKNSNYSIYAGELGTFGKAAGLGDIELLTGSSEEADVKVSMGNYVWIDEDQDGIQDPNEMPVANLLVFLRDSVGTVLDSTITDLQGRYYFEDIAPERNFYLTLGNLQDYNGKSLLINGEQYVPNTRRSRIGWGNNENDSDARYFNTLDPLIIRRFIGTEYATGKENENDFSIDFGLITCRDKGRRILDLEICANDSVFLIDTWFSVNHPSDTLVIQNGSHFGCDSIIYVGIEVLDDSRASLDTAICPSDVIQLGNRFFNADTLSGTVVLIGENQYGCDSIIDVSVQLLPEPSSILDTTICPGESLIIHQQIFNETRLNGTIILNGQSQLGCDSSIQVHVGILEESYSTLDTVLCPGEELHLHNEIFTEANNHGTIRLSGQDIHGCDSVLEVMVNYPSNNLTIPPLYEIEYGDSVQLQPKWQWPFVSYTWNPPDDLSCDSCPFPWASPLETMNYTLIGIDQNGCSYITQTKVAVNHEKIIYIPNVFSPNEDGVNDFFTVFANPFLEIVEELRIFNRWGDKVFHVYNIDANDELQGWDGTHVGRPMNPAVFVYVAMVRWKDGEREMFSGDVTLIK